MTMPRRITIDDKDSRAHWRAVRDSARDFARGVPLHWELAGPSGASFVLLPRQHHGAEEIEAAADYIRRERDAVRLAYIHPADLSELREIVPVYLFAWREMTDAEVARVRGSWSIPVFADQDTGRLLDLCTIAPDGLRSQMGGETLAEFRTRYPRAEVAELGAASARYHDSFITPPTEITREDFIQALECLPPLDWCGNGPVQSFKMSEFTCGPMTAIYAAIRGRYFQMTDRATLTHTEILAKVCAAFPELEQ